MNIQASKLELVKLIVDTDNDRIITKLLEVLKSEEKDFWIALSESEKKEIELGIKQLDAGQRISLEDFQTKVSQ
jgi:hypothetical protein